MGKRATLAGGVGLAIALLAVPAGAEEATLTSGDDVLLAGLYSDQWHAGADFEAFSAVAGQKPSLMGTFHHLWESEHGSPGNTDWLLEQAWSAQATPLANVEVMVAAGDIAAGLYDDAIAGWADRVGAWLDRGEGRSLLIAPLQEMNGDWVPYGMDPEGFRRAFRRFVEVFRAKGLDETVVRWVFAPNAWSVWPYRMADYYPGEEIVDLLGISVYNFGSIAGHWTGVEESGVAALGELRALAPGKPILLTQVGSSTAGGDRDAWLRELFNTAARDPNVVGLVYFNFDKETDWKVWDGAHLAAGFRDGMLMEATVHRWPLTGWFEPGPIPFWPHTGRFADDDAADLEADIDWLAARGITQGCAPGRYCPQTWVTREQLATFLARALTLPPSAVDYFGDDNGSPHEADINALAAAGITSGCGPESFCPGQLLSRQQLAGMLAVALHLPPSPSSAFRDISGTPHTAAIAALGVAGITSGCDAERFCPWDAVSREQMAAFLRRSLQTLIHQDRAKATPWLRGISPL